MGFSQVDPLLINPNNWHPTATKDLIRHGLHPDQLFLDSISRAYKVRWRSRKSVFAIEEWEFKWQQKYDWYLAGEDKPPAIDKQNLAQGAEAPRPAPLRRITQRLPDKLGDLTAIRTRSIDRPATPAVANDLEATCVPNYHTFAFDRPDLPCNNPTCQLHMQSEMAAMPNPKNKAWQILNLGDSKSSTRDSRKTSKGPESK